MNGYTNGYEFTFTELPGDGSLIARLRDRCVAGPYPTWYGHIGSYYLDYLRGIGHVQVATNLSLPEVLEVINTPGVTVRILWGTEDARQLAAQVAAHPEVTA